MKIAHQALQPLLDDMGVNLGRGNIGMAEQRLDDPQVRSIVQEMRSECVTQYMWTDQARRNAGRDRQFLEVTGEMLPCQMAAFAG